MTYKIGIIDYDAGNITSVLRAFLSLGYEAVIAKECEKLATCNRIVLPGVGEARYAMASLKARGWDAFLKAAINKGGVGVLGICLGSQIVFEHSAEGEVDCLGFIEGSVLPLQSLHKKNAVSLQIPHMGWNSVDLTQSAKGGSSLYEKALCKALDKKDFYFIHSYYIAARGENTVIGTCNYGGDFCAAVHKGAITAFQFHPEKSGKAGMDLLKCWVEKCTL